MRNRLSRRPNPHAEGKIRPFAGGLRSWSIAFAIAVCLGVIAGRGAFGTGYLLQVDTSWGPHAPPLQLGFYAPIGLAQQAAIAVFGGATVGKIYVLSVLALCAFAPMVALHKQALWIRLLCGAIGVFNPWVYERIVEGQWTVAAAGACLFLWLAAFEYLETTPGAKGAILLAASSALVIAFSPGFIAMLGILTVARLTLRDRPSDRHIGPSERGRRRNRALRLAALLTAIPVLAGAIQFALSHGPESYRRVRSFGTVDLKFFRTEGLPYGLPIRLLGLSGFWAERTGRFERLDAGSPWWPVVVLILAALTFAGAWRNRAQRWLLAVGIVGLGLSASTDVPLIRTIFGAVGRRLPLLLGFREPEKFAALWLVAVVMLIGYLLASLTQPPHPGPPWRELAIAVVVVLVVTLVGAGRQSELLATPLRPVTYPQSWYATSRYLKQHPVEGQTAVLPWHHYISLPFAGDRVVQNPADVFFPGDLLVSQDPEIGPGIADGASSDIEAAATGSDGRRCALAAALQAHQVDQVVVLPILEGPENLRELLRCGFDIAQGGATTTAVARRTRVG